MNIFYVMYQNVKEFLDSLSSPENPNQIALVNVADQRKGFGLAPLKDYDEKNFPFNLDVGRSPTLTQDPMANEYIEAFADLQIDIYRCILADQTLPAPKFLRKRWIAMQKKYHQDRPGGSHDKSILINEAKHLLDQLYDDALQQIDLFQAIYNTEEAKQQDDQLRNIEAIHSGVQTGAGRAPYMLLFFVGSGVGWALVKRRKAKT